MSYIDNFTEIIKVSYSTPGGFIGLISGIVFMGLFVFLFLMWKDLTTSLQDFSETVSQKYKSLLFIFMSVFIWGVLAIIFIGIKENQDFDDEPFLSLVYTHDTIGPSNQTNVLRSPFLSSRERLEYGPHTDKPKRNVIIILSDALRADHMGVYGYERNTTPWLNSLAQKEYVQKVDKNFSMCSETVCGVYSTLTSISPAENYISAFSLPYILSEDNYKINFLMSGMAKDYYELKSLIRTSAVDFLRDGHDCKSSFNDDNCLIENLKTLPESQGPSFSYIHMLSTHQVGTLHNEFDNFGHSNPTDIYDDKVQQADDYFRK